MKNNIIILLSLLLSSCSSQKIIEAGYVFQETTGSTHSIFYKNTKNPISFDLQSNKLSINSLQALSPSILYPNSGGKQIFLIGELNQDTNSFILHTWYIKLPFQENVIVNEEEIPHDIEIITRTTLKASDFSKSTKFNPETLQFNPKKYTKK